MMMRLSALLAMASVLLLCSTAHAQGRTHDGFYLRLGVGFGYTSDKVEGTLPVTVPFVSGDVEGTPEGASGATEIALGGTLGSGLVLGGGIWSAYVPSPVADDVEVSGIEVEDIEFDDSAFHVIGPFIDYYVDPHSGLHLQAALGFGVLTAGDGRTESGNVQVSEDHTAAGFGFMVGFGHEWWVGDSWGLGVLGRLTAGFLSGEDDNEVEWNHTVLSPALLFTATMN